MTQGTVNGGDRGNVEDRRRRREWLVETFRANTDAIQRTHADGSIVVTDSPFTVDGRSDIEAGVRYWARVIDRQANPRLVGPPPPLSDVVVEVKAMPACRCYRCGQLLTVDTVSPDRIIPGCKGGTYKRSNIRPSCLPCQYVTGNEIKRAVRR